MKKNESRISRSIPQILTAHLPGSIKSSEGLFYKMDEIYVSKDTIESNKDISLKRLIYLDFIKNINKWLKNAQELNNLNSFKLDEYISARKDDKLSEINWGDGYDNQLNRVYFFQEDNWNVDELLSPEDETERTSQETWKTSNKGSYFPYTWKCNNCNIIKMAKNYPDKDCKCGQNNWKQLSVVFTSSMRSSSINLKHKVYGDVVSIGEPILNSKNRNSDDIYKGQPLLTCTTCKQPLKIEENQDVSQYELFCSANKQHLNKIDEGLGGGYTLYSLYSGSLYIPHRGEFINFGQEIYYQNNDIKIMKKIIDEGKIKEPFKKINRFLEDYDDWEKDQSNEETKNDCLSLIGNIILDNKNNKIFELERNKLLSQPDNETDLLKFYHQRIISKYEKNLLNNNWDRSLFNFSRIGLINDIQVVNYTYAFSRIADRPISTQSQQVKLKFFYSNSQGKVTGNPFAEKEKEPKKQIIFNKESNQGIFFELDEEKLDEKLLKHNKNEFNSYEFHLEKRRLKEIYIHSLCHYLIRLISEKFSGVSTSSLTEMLFPEQNSFLIYKKGTGKELGYLEAFFKDCIEEEGNRFDEFWSEVNNLNNLYCPASEICEGSCVECLIISKHSCKHENENLNRNIFF